MDRSSEDDFDLLMRRHGLEVLPQAREAATRLFDELTAAARLVRLPRPMTAHAAYVLRANEISRIGSGKT